MRAWVAGEVGVHLGITFSTFALTCTVQVCFLDAVEGAGRGPVPSPPLPALLTFSKEPFHLHSPFLSSSGPFVTCPPYLLSLE